MKTIAKNLNRRGQVTTELVLMMVISMGIVLAVTTAAKQSSWLANLVAKPWQSIASMIQNGVPGTVNATAQQHPNNYVRWSTVKGDLIQ